MPRWCRSRARRRTSGAAIRPSTSAASRPTCRSGSASQQPGGIDVRLHSRRSGMAKECGVGLVGVVALVNQDPDGPVDRWSARPGRPVPRPAWAAGGRHRARSASRRRRTAVPSHCRLAEPSCDGPRAWLEIGVPRATEAAARSSKARLARRRRHGSPSRRPRQARRTAAERGRDGSRPGREGKRLRVTGRSMSTSRQVERTVGGNRRLEAATSEPTASEGVVVQVQRCC